MRFLPYAVAAAALAGSGLALPFEVTVDGLESDVSGNSTEVLGKRADGGLLRILPVGASIMYGANGYQKSGLRQPLKGWLMNDPSTTFDVNFVGAKQCYQGLADPYKDNDCHAVSGRTIRQIAEETNIEESYKYKPNIVIINAGTNNCFQNADWPNADRYMRNLIQKLNTQEGFKQTAMYIVSTLPPFRAGSAHETCRQSINYQIRRLVTTMQGEQSPGRPAGVTRRIALVDLDHCGLSHPADFRKLNGEDDEVHPNDYGYEKIGKCFFNTIMQFRHWIVPPFPREGW